MTFFDTYNSVTEVLGTVEVQSRNGRLGTAILRTEVGGIGTHQFKATYGGTSTYQGSSSSPQSVTFAGPIRPQPRYQSLVPGPTPYRNSIRIRSGCPYRHCYLYRYNRGSEPGHRHARPPTTPAGFSSFQTYPIANMDNGNTGGTNGPAIGDFNSDGRPDYAVPTNGGANGGGPVVILLGNGDGTFTTGTPVNTTSFHANIRSRG